MKLTQRMTTIVATLMLAACASTDKSREPYVGNMERKGFVGGILLADASSPSTAPKVIVASYAIDGGAFTPKESLVAYGGGGKVASSGDDYTVELVNASGRVLQSYQVTDPRKSVVENQGIVENPAGVLTTRFSFEPTATTVRVRDRSSAIVAETNVRALILEFCRRAPNDAECRKATQGD